MDEDERASTRGGDEDFAPEDDGEEEPYADEEDEPSEGDAGEEPSPEEEAEAAEPAARAAASAVNLGPVLSEEEAERIADELGFTPSQLALAANLFSRIAQHHSLADRLAGSAVAAEASVSPEFFAEYGSRIHQNLERVAPQQRANRRMVQMAAVMAYLEGVPETESLASAIAGLSRKLDGQAASRPPRPVLPPERRVPTPGATGRAAPPATGRDSGGRFTPRTGGQDEVVRGFLSRFGLSAEDAADVRRALRSRGGWR